VLAGAIVLTTVGLLRGERLVIAEVSTASWLALVYLVVLGSLIAYTSYVWLLGNVPISLVSTYAYVNPVVAVVLGTIVFGEAISADVIVGITVVLGGVVLVVTGESRRRVSSATTQRRR
jgi:drug/metabolite transporter (DMT)-like permease